MSGNNTMARPGENPPAARERCPDGECEMSWEYPAGTSFGIPSCQICKRINGYALQNALNELVAKTRATALGRVHDRISQIPPGSRYRWKAVDADMVFLSRVLSIVEEERSK